MVCTIVTAAEIQNDFMKYLNLVIEGHEVIVTNNGREVGRFVSKAANVSYLTDSLIGILKGNYDLDGVKSERLRENMKLLIDANVMWDVLQKREPHVKGWLMQGLK